MRYNIEVETILAQGYPPDAIVREADAKGADLIVWKQRIQRSQTIFYRKRTKFSIASFKYSCFIRNKGICIEMKYTPSIKISTSQTVITCFLVVSASCVLQSY